MKIKKLLLLLAVPLLAISFTACDNDKPEEIEPYLTVFPEDLNFPSEGGEIEVKVESNVPLSYSWLSNRQPEYVTITNTEIGIKVIVSPNPDFSARGADLSVFTGEHNGKSRHKLIVIYQVGKSQF